MTAWAWLVALPFVVALVAMGTVEMVRGSWRWGLAFWGISSVLVAEIVVMVDRRGH